MKNKKLVIIAAVLVLVAAIAAAVHFMTAPKAAEGDVILTYGGKTMGITLADLELTDVNGVRVNGKGEEIEVNGKGISVKDLLHEYGVADFTKISVVSEDSYAAEIENAEVQEEGKAYILVEEGEARLVVFGDTNSKRSVSNVKQIIVE